MWKEIKIIWIPVVKEKKQSSKHHVDNSCCTYEPTRVLMEKKNNNKCSYELLFFIDIRSNTVLRDVYSTPGEIVKDPILNGCHCARVVRAGSPASPSARYCYHFYDNCRIRTGGQRVHVRCLSLVVATVWVKLPV